MIIRRSSEGYNVILYRNTTPGATRTRTYSNSTVEEITYPTSYKYFIAIDNEVKKRTNNWETAENFYIDECEKKGYTSHGRAIIGAHIMLGSIITLESEFPTSSNTKTQIQEFMNLRNIKYNSSDTKAELLAIVDIVNPWKAT
tara:strand:+ start:358 stop:786 length:429 start_codon:yes stop_codon:yes gene_type:complete